MASKLTGIPPPQRAVGSKFLKKYFCFKSLMKIKIFIKLKELYLYRVARGDFRFKIFEKVTGGDRQVRICYKNLHQLNFYLQIMRSWGVFRKILNKSPGANIIKKKN